MTHASDPYCTNPLADPLTTESAYAPIGTEPPLPVPVPQHEAPADESDGSVQERAAQSADAGKQAVSDVASTATDKAQDVAAEAKQQARNVVDEARSQVRQQAQDQHRNLVTNLRSLGDELRSMADRSEDSGPATDLVGRAGQRAHGAADWLDSRDPDQVLDEVRRFARRKPGVFVLGALGAGVLAGRLTRGVVDVHRDDDQPGTAGPDARPRP